MVIVIEDTIAKTERVLSGMNFDSKKDAYEQIELMKWADKTLDELHLSIKRNIQHPYIRRTDRYKYYIQMEYNQVLH